MSYNLANILRGRTKRKRIIFRPFRTPRSLEAELRAIQLELLRRWRIAIKDRLLPRLVRSGLVTDSVDDVDRFFEGERASNASFLQVELTPSLESWIVRVLRWHEKRWSKSAERAAGLDLKAFMQPLDTADEIAAFTARSASLIRDLNASTEKRIADLVYDAVQNNTPRRELAKQLRSAFGIERRRALTIARDQTTKLAGKLDELRNIEAGIEEYDWVHSGKKNPREHHVERDGKRFRWDSPPSDGHPGYAINCGCTSRAVLNLELD